AVGTENQHAANQKITLGQWAKTDDRVGDPRFAKDKPGSGQNEQQEENLNSPEYVPQPVPLFSLAENDLPAGDGDCEQTQANRVEVQRLLAKFRALLFEIGGVGHQNIRGQECQYANGNVDVENPSPAIVVGEVASQRGTNDRSDERRDAEQGHRRSLLFP